MLASLPASTLNLRTEVAQVGVSTLGKMFSTLRFAGEVFQGHVGEVAADQAEGRSLGAFLRELAIDVDRVALRVT